MENINRLRNLLAFAFILYNDTSKHTDDYIIEKYKQLLQSDAININIKAIKRGVQYLD